MKKSPQKQFDTERVHAKLMLEHISTLGREVSTSEEYIERVLYPTQVLLQKLLMETDKKVHFDELDAYHTRRLIKKKRKKHTYHLSSKEYDSKQVRELFSQVEERTRPYLESVEASHLHYLSILREKFPEFEQLQDQLYQGLLKPSLRNHRKE